ncbi:2-dehydropantoate 2-reductase [Trinickia caryophylli]|uniref:2-dehydropantoate 2-reductase n=1 Tax=Trinickia caryophylli TaxID=28094 RepID=A0A1X7DI35_TRICW|nr:2-dehydropantoate 2-reductase [Trinickia caryophylli]PMS12292.1 2-dehydropantoate 2-reductase [Trinickia caryophylli]TRX17035.1 2-dehydropantoate 2-reductase [Trinickia caryophylli]WQE12227.1 2-dehydropantoate 2-reductase [Trinickia caryophylli]SMF16007.1 ketopantoate reductase [Trinickia caryophylli]GLU31633.1 2-dehydropantoate 2-reductase [Trinickia caryophylli]
MKICVYGAGAIGAYMGARLAEAGAEVSFIARGPHLAAMQKNGVRVRTEEGERTVNVRSTSDPGELGEQDYVVVALKAHSVPGVVEAMQPLLGPKTAIVTAVNGIPYWYFHRHGGEFEGTTLESVDPGGTQWVRLGPERAIGCVLYPAAEIVEPGVIRHVYGKKFPIGEPGGERTPRILALQEAMTAAGFDAPIRDDIRDEIWLKLWGNLCFNPISALTHATLDVLTSHPGTRAVSKTMMLEAKSIADRFGVHFRVDVERRIDGAGAVGAHKTSMLQDLEHGRPMEIDPLLTVVQEMGRLVGQPTPTIDTVLALIKLREQTAQQALRANAVPAPATERPEAVGAA